jgi:PAB1-binding protein PBP1
MYHQYPHAPIIPQCLHSVAFKTDTDIGQKVQRRDRELQAWQADTSSPATAPGGPTHGPHTDDITFGAGSSGHGGWNQFTVNEKLFGVKTGFDEELYTTKLDRSAADFAEREKKAQALANEIMRVRSDTHHTLLYVSLIVGCDEQPTCPGGAHHEQRRGQRNE